MMNMFRSDFMMYKFQLRLQRNVKNSLLVSMLGFLFCFVLIFAVTSQHFCGSTGNLCFGLWLTLLMGFKAKVDAPWLVLYSHLHIMILRVNFESNLKYISCSNIAPPDSNPRFHSATVI